MYRFTQIVNINFIILKPRPLHLLNMTPTDNLETTDIFYRLTHLMQLKKLTPYAFSKELGFSKPAKLYAILHKKAKPSFDTLLTIATRYDDVSCDWLLRGLGEPVRVLEMTPIIVRDNRASDSELQMATERHNMMQKQLEDRNETIELLKQQIMLLREVIQRDLRRNEEHV